MRTSLCVIGFLLGCQYGFTATVTNAADNGPGSLRDAIQVALPGETILFEVTGSIVLTNQELVIDKDLILLGPGPTNLTVERAAGSPAFRIFNVFSGSVVISGLSIRGGESSAGGGIHNEADLALTNVIIVGNTALEFGGGINNQGTLGIYDSLILSNQVTAPNPGGGGIHNAGALLMADTAVRQNLVTGDAAQGGGIRTEAFLSAQRVLIEQNVALAGAAGEADGGGIHNSGSLVLDESTVRDNRADSAGALTQGSARGGGILNEDGTASVNRSTISGNVARSGRSEPGMEVASLGGGIASLFATLSLTNSTVSGNWLEQVSGTTEQMTFGGGIYSLESTTRLFHSTVISNAVVSLGSDGGGLYASAGTIEIRNTILAANQALLDVAITNDNAFVSGGFNLLGNVTPSLPAETNDQFNVSVTRLQLGPLQVNGGFTFTHALACSSSARDAGSNSNSPPTDQRGFPRIRNELVDIGSYEAEPSAPESGGHLHSRFFDGIIPLDGDISSFFDPCGQPLSGVCVQLDRQPPGPIPQAPADLDTLGLNESPSGAGSTKDGLLHPSGFNQRGIMSAYNPDLNGGTVYVGIDLPGGTGTLANPTFSNSYGGLSVRGQVVPFDADGNGDADNIGSMSDVVIARCPGTPGSLDVWSCSNQSFGATDNPRNGNGGFDFSAREFYTISLSFTNGARVTASFEVRSTNAAGQAGLVIFQEPTNSFVVKVSSSTGGTGVPLGYDVQFAIENVNANVDQASRLVQRISVDTGSNRDGAGQGEDNLSLICVYEPDEEEDCVAPLRITSIRYEPPDQVTLEWLACTNRSYSVLRSELPSRATSTIVARGLPGMQPITTFTDSTATNQTQFYWIELEN